LLQLNNLSKKLMIVFEHLSHIFLEQSQSQPLAFVIALLVAFVITPVIQERAQTLKLSDRKENRRTINVPRLGGVAIMVSFVITIIFYLAVFGRYTPHGVRHLDLEAIAVGALIIFVVGLLDDIKPLAPQVKLLGQILAASSTWLMGLRIEFLANPIHYIDHARFSAAPLDDLTSFVVTVFFLVAITNAINLIDGIDGLAVGVCMIAAIASWAINLSPLLNQPAGAVLAATMAGACFGFLRYNFNPAKIFLGDNGSYLLGFILACISCVGLVKKITVVILSPILLLIFAVPLFDIVYAVLRRATKKQAIMKPDLDHLHHKLLASGLSQKQINYLLYTITFLGGLIGTWILGLDIALEYSLISLSIVSAWLFFSLVINYKRNTKR
jgi:UDP-GlcNAc:undecaprenyl-phosphate/decaprenyl-phosphate GlcNAc-1-phosphate transferase